MTNSFQSTAFRSSASPVDTFVEPVRVQPKTDAEQLASALTTVNPKLETILNVQFNKTIKEEKRKGIKIAFEEAQEGFKGVIKNVRNKEGNEIANKLIGGSIFADREYNKVKAELLGDTYTNQVESLYNSKTYEIATTEGKTINVPLSHFPVDSPQFKDFLQETNTLASDLTVGIDEDNIFENFYPKQVKQINKTVTDHIDNHNTYNFNRLKKQSYGIITSAYGDYRDGNKDVGINKINTFINQKVLLGITQDNENKFFDALLDYTISLRDEAYTLDGMDGSKNVLEMMRGIKYGPNGASIFETHPKFLSEMHKQTIKHIKDKDAIDIINDKNKRDEAETEILKRISKLGDEEGDLPYSTIQSIREYGSKYGVDVSWIDQKIDIFIPDRQKVLKDFSLELTDGAYIGRPSAAVDAFGVILNSLGPLTKQEKGIKTRIISQIESSRKGQTDGGKQELNTIIQRLRKQINPSYDSIRGLYTLQKGETDPTEFMLNLERKLNRDYIEYVFFTDDNNDGKFDTRSKKDIFDYLKKVEDEAILKVKKWQGGDGGDNDSITLPSKIFKTLSGNDAYEQITIDGQTAYKDKESGQIYISDDIIDINEGNSGQPLDPLNKTKRKKINTDNIEPGFFSGDSPTTVTVEKGDTLFGLADQFSTTVKAIKDANGLDSDLIKIGQELIMPIGDGEEQKIKIKEPKIKYSSDPRVQSIVKSANELGINPIDLAAVIAQESSFRPSVVSVDKATNKKYTGLIQFGPYEIAKYKIKPDMTFEEQMVAVTSFLKDRGVRPGHGPKEIYAAIFTGNVSNLDKGGADWSDSNGTTVNKALPNLSEGGSKYKMAIDFLTQTGTYSPKPKK